MSHKNYLIIKCFGKKLRECPFLVASVGILNMFPPDVMTTVLVTANAGCMHTWCVCGEGEGRACFLEFFKKKKNPKNIFWRIFLVLKVAEMWVFISYLSISAFWLEWSMCCAGDPLVIFSRSWCACRQALLTVEKQDFLLLFLCQCVWFYCCFAFQNNILTQGFMWKHFWCII